MRRRPIPTLHSACLGSDFPNKIGTIEDPIFLSGKFYGFREGSMALEVGYMQTLNATYCLFFHSTEIPFLGDGGFKKRSALKKKWKGNF